MGTWNAAGIAVAELDTFVEQTSDNYAWDVLLIQEGFRRLDGLELSSGHLIFTSGHLVGNLRCPAILVHERWVGKVDIRYAGSGGRWVAVEFGEHLLFVSLHLPHAGSSLTDFQETLAEVTQFRLTKSHRHFFLGMDANTSVNTVIDHYRVGPAVLPRLYDSRASHRASLLHTFLVDTGTWLSNTFVDSLLAADIYTRANWCGVGVAQIDFLGLPLGVPCSRAGVDSQMLFSSDHRYVWSELPVDMQVSSQKRCRSMKRWQPDSERAAASRTCAWDWHCWEETSEAWRRLARRHRLRKPMAVDEGLANLLQMHANAGSSEQKRELNKMIWRHRRRAQRQRKLQQIENVLSGSSATSIPRNLSINWEGLFGTKRADHALYEYFTDIHELSPEESVEEIEAKDSCHRSWQTLKINYGDLTFSVETISKAISKLRLGKASPDGCTAEMFRALPGDALQKLAYYFSGLFYDMNFPMVWTQVEAKLIPKCLGATSLDRFRAISRLCTARKLLGHLWVQTLPVLNFESIQTGFVPKSHASDGIFAIKRAAELSREWGKKLYIAQLDLKRAFDRVKHSAVLNALTLQGGSPQCIATICAILQQSSTNISLGHVSSEAVVLRRGLPQGAPESPLIFVLVTELVLRPLLRKWATRGSGWCLDSFSLTAVCFADDIVLSSGSKKDLEKMLDEVLCAFAVVCLAVGAEKCHWTSWPACRQSSLKIAGAKLPWEQSITFVGGILCLSGNDGLAMEHRLAQAEKNYFRWAAVLKSDAPLRRRLELLSENVFSSALWLSETWVLTKKQQSRLGSWGARMVARVGNLQRGAAEDIGQYWRRLHRFGHSWLRSMGGNLDFRRLCRLHSYAGHLARTSNCFLQSALRTRCLAWWRFRQRRYHSRVDGLHPKRFKVWRWEAQIVHWHGESEVESCNENAGCMQAAQDREAWKTSEAVFAFETCS